MSESWYGSDSKAWFYVSLIISIAMVAVGLLYWADDANANPATPVPVIEERAVVFCNAVNANPTAEGVVTGLEQAALPSMDEIDGAYVLITAVHHTCAQHEALIMDVVGDFAYPDAPECKQEA